MLACGNALGGWPGELLGTLIMAPGGHRLPFHRPSWGRGLSLTLSWSPWSLHPPKRVSREVLWFPRTTLLSLNPEKGKGGGSHHGDHRKDVLSRPARTAGRASFAAGAQAALGPHLIKGSGGLGSCTCSATSGLTQLGVWGAKPGVMSPPVRAPGGVPYPIPSGSPASLELGEPLACSLPSKLAGPGT